MITRMLVLAGFAAMAVLGARAEAFDGEKQLYEAGKKEKEFTWYTAHYDSETAAAVCNGFEKQYSAWRRTRRRESPRPRCSAPLTPATTAG